MTEKVLGECSSLRGSVHWDGDRVRNNQNGFNFTPDDGAEVMIFISAVTLIESWIGNQMNYNQLDMLYKVMFEDGEAC